MWHQISCKWHKYMKHRLPSTNQKASETTIYIYFAYSTSTFPMLLSTWELLNLTLGSQLQHGIPLFLLWHLIGRRGPICYLPSTIFTPEVWSQLVYKRVEIICVKIDNNWNTYTPCIVQHAYHLKVRKTIVKNCTPEWHIKRHKMKCL